MILLDTTFIVAAVAILTVLGDYFIKRASAAGGPPISGLFLVGALLYALPAVGWFYLMRSHSLATIGVLYSASIILLLAALGVFAFGERLGRWEILGLVLAVGSVLAMAAGSES